MKLYYFETLQPRKVCATAKYLKAPVAYVYVDPLKGELRSPWYLALNPNGKVPTLTDGETSLWEADAIMCALAAGWAQTCGHMMRGRSTSSAGSAGTPSISIAPAARSISSIW